eukprot:6189009-Pyramimonas_sp.AAC.1
MCPHHWPRLGIFPTCVHTIHTVPASDQKKTKSDARNVGSRLGFRHRQQGQNGDIGQNLSKARTHSP